MQTCILIYLAAVNGIAFLLCGIDKWKARRERWRIPEKTLFLSAILGGSVGFLLGMQLFRHKTKHKSFTIGIPLILALQIGLAAWLLMRG
ncbi:MAG: DUF1294 domain-containing protein [Clostridia bacterium]|nr:DUF1294 domain-containing protein [Clostridia bacterium]MBQ3091808.1 DUF1294 domain-containing protein [Clostridia bacterium]MBQ9924968.1 DUF1294 domain-containing protein [Clostridia bacterium]